MVLFSTMMYLELSQTELCYVIFPIIPRHDPDPHQVIFSYLPNKTKSWIE